MLMFAAMMMVSCNPNDEIVGIIEYDYVDLALPSGLKWATYNKKYKFKSAESKINHNLLYYNYFKRRYFKLMEH